MLVYRFTIATATCMAALLVGCTDPDLPTDLRRNGPPNVTTVTVMGDLVHQFLETATFCRINDAKRPGLVGLPDISTLQVCPDDLAMPAEFADVAEAAPQQWWVRVVFDRLLDPDIEDLVPELDSRGNPTDMIMGTLRNTQPVILKCNDVEVPYDGYYVPDGNRNSWPLGPALYIQPLAPENVATGASCTVALKNNIHSKSGESVPVDQRDYRFKTAAMALLASNPAPADSEDGKFLLDVDQPVKFTFTAGLASTMLTIPGTNLKVLASSVLPAQVQLFSGPNAGVTVNNPNGSANPAVCGGGGDPVSSAKIHALVGGDTGEGALRLQIDARGSTSTGSKAMWDPSTTYRLRFDPAARVSAAQRGETRFPDGFELCFHTTAASAHP